MVSSTRKRRYDSDPDDSNRPSIQAETTPKRARRRRRCPSYCHGPNSYAGTTSQHTPTSLCLAKTSVAFRHGSPIPRDTLRITSGSQTGRHGTPNSGSNHNNSPPLLEQEIEIKNHRGLGYPTPPSFEEGKVEEKSDTSYKTRKIWTCNEAQLQISGSDSVSESQLEPVMLCDPAGKDFEKAWNASLEHERYRAKKYGDEIAREWKRGSTPDDARKQYAAKCRALVEDISDSE